jgi:hypothetical protein
VPFSFLKTAQNSFQLAATVEERKTLLPGSFKSGILKGLGTRSEWTMARTREVKSALLFNASYIVILHPAPFPHSRAQLIKHVHESCDMS